MVEKVTRKSMENTEKLYTLKQVLRAIDLATQVFEKKDAKIVYAGPMSAQSIINTLEQEEHTNPGYEKKYQEFPPKENPLSRPAVYPLSKIFKELKFGRPAESQEYLDKLITELEIKEKNENRAK